MRKRTLLTENFCDTVYIDQRDNSTRLVYGDINGPHIKKIISSAKNYFAKNLGNGSVIITEVTEQKDKFVADGRNIPTNDPVIIGDSFVKITVPIAFKCVEIEEDLFKIQWRADYKPDDTWKEVPTDELLFGSDFIVKGNYASNGYDNEANDYNYFYSEITKRGDGYSMLKYAFVSMFKALSLCKNGSDIETFNSPDSFSFMKMNYLTAPPTDNYQEILTGVNIISGNDFDTVNAIDIDGKEYSFNTTSVGGISGFTIKKLRLSPNLDMIPKEFIPYTTNYYKYKSQCWLGRSASNKYVYNNGGNSINSTKNTIYSSSLENDGSKKACCRLMFQGKINYTQDIDYYLSLPNS